MRLRLVSLLAVLAALLVSASPAAASSNVYATQGSGTGGLSVFTIGPTGALTTTTGSPYALSAFPAGITFSPTSDRLYAGGSGPFGFSITPSTGALTALPGSPYMSTGQAVAEIVMDPSGNRVYVPLGLNNKLRVFDVGADGGLTQNGSDYAIPDAPLGAAMTPDGKHLYVPRANAGQINGYDVAADGTLTERPDSPYPGGTGPFSAAVTPDGKHLYVVDFTASQMRGYDIAANGSITATPGSPYGGFSQPIHLVISPDGKFLYVANQGTGVVAGFSINANGSVAGLPSSPYVAGTGAKGIGMTPDGKHLYTANLFSNNVSAFDVAANGVLSNVAGTPFPLPAGGTGLAVTPDHSPTAAFTAKGKRNSKVVDFDAGASTDTDGTIARYDWDFGDGTTLADGGPTPSHTYAADGNYTASVTLTDDVGCSTDPKYTGVYAYCSRAVEAAVSSPVTVDSVVKGAKLKAKKKQRVSGGKVVIVAKVKAGEKAKVKLGGNISAGNKTIRLEKVSKSLKAGKPKKIKLIVRRSQEVSKVERALGGKVTAKLQARFTDDLGNKAKKKAKVALLPAA